MTFQIEFTGNYALQAQDLITADTSGLTADASTINISRTQTGSADDPLTPATNVLTFGLNIMSGYFSLTHPDINSGSQLNISINSVTPDLESVTTGVSDQAGSTQVYTLYLGAVPLTGVIIVNYTGIFGLWINPDGTCIFNGSPQASIQAAFDNLINPNLSGYIGGGQTAGGPWTCTGSPSDGSTITFTGSNTTATVRPWTLASNTWGVSVDENYVDGTPDVTGNNAVHSLALPGAWGGTWTVDSSAATPWNISQGDFGTLWTTQTGKTITSLTGSGVAGDPWLISYNGNGPVSLPTINGSKLIGFTNLFLQDTVGGLFNIAGDFGGPYTLTSTPNGAGQTEITASANEQALITHNIVDNFVAGSVSYSTTQSSPNQIDQLQVSASAGNFSLSDGNGHTVIATFDCSGTNLIVGSENAGFTDGLSSIDDLGITDGVHTYNIVFISAPANPWFATADTSGTTTTLTVTQALHHIVITALDGTWGYTDTNGTFGNIGWNVSDSDLKGAIGENTSSIVAVNTYSSSGNSRSIALYYNGDPGSVSVDGTELIDGLIALDTTFAQPIEVVHGVIGVTAAYPTWTLTLSGIPDSNYLVLAYTDNVNAIDIRYDNTNGFEDIQTLLNNIGLGAWTYAGSPATGGPLTFTYNAQIALGSNPWSIQTNYWQVGNGTTVTPSWQDGAAGVATVQERQAIVTAYADVTSGIIGGKFSLTGDATTVHNIPYSISASDLSVHWQNATGGELNFSTNYGPHGYEYVFDDYVGPVTVPTTASEPSDPLIANGTLINNFTDGTTDFGQNEIQTVTLADNPTSGQWSITLDSHTLSPLDHNIAAGDLQAALRSVWSDGSLTVTGSNPYAIDFVNHASRNMITADGTGMTITPIMNIIEIQRGQN